MVKLQEIYREAVSQEAIDLFVVFARFEYAMKKGGFRRDNRAEASWNRFANQLPASFFAELQAAPEAGIYFNEPPDHLVINAHEGVRWSGEPQAVNDPISLFRAIKTARNNLFHGEKCYMTSRDRELMAAALFILNAAFDVATKEAAFADFMKYMW
jgi:hypothetical protein